MSTIFDGTTTEKQLPSIQDDDVNGYCQFEDAWCWLALFSNLFPSIFIFILFFRHPNTIQSTAAVTSDSNNFLRSNTANTNLNFCAQQDSKLKEILLPCIFSFGSKIMLCCLCCIQSLFQVIESIILSHSSGWTVSLQTNVANCIWIMFVFILLRRDRKQAKATQPPTQAAVALLSLSQAATIILMKISPSVTLTQILFIPSCFQLFLFLFLLVFLLLTPADFMIITLCTKSFSIKKQRTLPNDCINPFSSEGDSPINQTVTRDFEKAQTTQNSNNINNRTNSQNKPTRFIDDTTGNTKLNLNENLILAADLGSFNENNQPLGLKDHNVSIQQKNLMNQSKNTQKMIFKEENPRSDVQNVEQQQYHNFGSSCILLQDPQSQQQFKQLNTNLKTSDNSKDLELQKPKQISPSNITSNHKQLKIISKKLSHQSSSSFRSDATQPYHRSSSALLPSREVPLLINQPASTTEHLQYSAYPGLCISSFFREERFCKRTVLFTVEYTSPQTSKKITVLRSYREFSDLRKSLEAQCSDLTFAQFPKKLQKQQLSQNDLIERACLFQEYLRSVVAQLNPPLPILVSFLSPSKDIFSSKSSKKFNFTKLMPEAILEDSNDCSCSASQPSYKLEQ